MAASAMAKLCNSYRSQSHRLSKPAQKKLFNCPKFILTSSNSTLSLPPSSYSPSPIQASNSPTEDETSSTDEIIPREDVKYLWKLGAGSVAAAALIKYGSVLFPQITTPNLLFALIIIAAPVLVSVFILFNKSRSN